MGDVSANARHDAGGERLEVAQRQPISVILTVGRRPKWKNLPEKGS